MSLSVGNAALLPGRNLIGSEWREAALGARFAVADPATGKVIAHVPDSGARDAGAAVTAAHQAFADWRRTPPRSARRSSSAGMPCCTRTPKTWPV
ncbi:succinate-semialdehyde dehydrogenase [Bordetella pertussis]|nr:succinate-semialdehyde dehydrogenase [Bordetella pertussis]